MTYAIEFQGKAFTPDGQKDVGDVQSHNKAIETKEIEELKQHPDRLFLYVRMPEGSEPQFRYYSVRNGVNQPVITTWLGTVVSENVQIGQRVRSGFGFHSYRRSVQCRIFGQQYHGWFFESSGEYCRLKKAKS